MPDEPTPPTEPTPESTPEFTDASAPSESEWTDDLDFSQPEPVAPPSLEANPEEWGDDLLEWEAEDATASAQSPSTREALAWLSPLWQRGLALWRRLLAGVRMRIPAAAQISDRVLSGILVAGLGLLLVVLNRLGSPAAAQDTPPPSTAPTPTPTAIAPPAPVPVAEPTPQEGDRIGQIQAQLTDGSLTEAQGLVDSVQADFTHNELTITLNSGWYRLSTQEQDTLASQLMMRSDQLNFETLYLRSPDDRLLARTPVIGDTIVIFQREQPPAVEPPPQPRFRITIDR